MKPSLLLALAFVAAATTTAAAQDHCSRETLDVRGTPVTIAYCISGQPAHTATGLALAVQGTYSAPARSFSRTSTMHFIAGDGPSRVLENVDLGQLGIQGTLHLTLLYGGGAVKIESAMLTPGAVTIK